jgi:hypothetical protein
MMTAISRLLEECRPSTHRSMGRCKPGATNSRQGRLLHPQATLAANLILNLFPGVGIVEGFPNAFLGAMLPDEVFRMPIPRGKKSDVFWRYCVDESGIMSRLLAHLFGESGALLFERCRQDLQYERDPAARSGSHDRGPTSPPRQRREEV